jgi:23S rRNA pseudouridine1911/1915/1917 synthase
LSATPLNLILEDGPLLAVNKPPGLLTVGAIPGVPTLERQVKDHLREKYQKPGNVYLGIPHRLDRPVSGVVVFARNSKCADRLAEQFRDRTVRKTYWAVVAGEQLPDTGEWTDWLLKEPDQALVRVVAADAPGAREARLRFRCLARLPASHPTEPPRSLVEIELDTGRMHQIRVQFASRGFPVLGDLQYGSGEPFGPATSDSRDAPIALHARQLELKHPIRYDTLVLEAPLPEAWSEVHSSLPEGLPTR